MIKELNIDLKQVKNKEQVLKIFEESFILGSDWGRNWDALQDYLCYLEDGGIFGTGYKFDLPFSINILNYSEFKKNDPVEFEILREIMNTVVDIYKINNKILKIAFIN